MKPKLRPLDVRPFTDQGRPMLLLRDPTGVSEKSIIVPQGLGPLLALFDGSRDESELYSDFIEQTRIEISPEIVRQMIDHLDEALLLENDRFLQAQARALEAYRSASFRPASLAGGGYAEDVEDLRRQLDGYLAADPAETEDDDTAAPQGRIVGLVSPHIDYQRGGPVYARLWTDAAQALREAELVVMFGTDHASERSLITLTRQNYATPYGVLPTDRQVVDAVAAAIGEEEAFAEEMHHQAEHSIELAAVWLHHIRGGEPVPLVPILCGSFYPFLVRGGQPQQDRLLQAALDALKQATQGRKVVYVAAADLAHIGPAFSDPFLIDYVRYLRLEIEDQRLMQTMIDSDAEAFYDQIAAEDNRRNVCGLAPIYMTLRMLDGTVKGRTTGYERCPADPNNTSFVSICGMIFYEQEPD